MAGHRADIYDRSALLLSHSRQHGPDTANHSKDICFIHALECLDAHLLNRPQRSDAGIIDENIYRALALQDVGYCTIDRVLVGHIKLDKLDSCSGRISRCTKV